jgi:hypothetical protein
VRPSAGGWPRSRGVLCAGDGYRISLFACRIAVHASGCPKAEFATSVAREDSRAAKRGMCSLNQLATTSQAYGVGGTTSLWGVRQLRLPALLR